MDSSNDQNPLEWEEFERVDMRIATILEAVPNPKASNPSYVLTLDLGEEGKKTSSAQITEVYSPEDLIGKQVVVVVNFPPKRIAGVKSECLVLGAYSERGVVLLSPTHPIQNGDVIG